MPGEMPFHGFRSRVCATAELSRLPHHPQRTLRGAERWRNGRSLQSRAKSFRVLEVRGHGGAHILKQRLELRVLGRRNQHLVDRIKDGLMVRDLAIDVRAIESGAMQRLELLACIG